MVFGGEIERVWRKKEREKEGEQVESRLGYSFCHCCMMFNMPDRGRLAEVLYRGQNAAELRSLDGKSCLHPIFHFASLPSFSFAFISGPPCFHISLSWSYVHSLSLMFLSPHSLPFPLYSVWYFFVLSLSFFLSLYMFVYVCVFVLRDVLVDLWELHLFSL